jgi:ADP-ribosylglycohydrolase
MKRDLNHFQGCLLGGAIGDALGWPVEFLSLAEIIRTHGDDGITDLPSLVGGAEITDDTQLTLFTAEGILRAVNPGLRRTDESPLDSVYAAYQRWLSTQGYPRDDRWSYDGWLLSLPVIHARRAPGNSCISALRGAVVGTVAEPVNDSKGCGGIMRVAPAGLVYAGETAFRRAMDFAALTHGNPSGYLPAGALAYLVARIIEGLDLDSAVDETLRKLEEYPENSESSESLRAAKELSTRESLSDREAIRLLGEGWTGHEALGIAVYSVLRHRTDFVAALVCAVNHDGDSDSTGAIAGNILGAYLGADAIPGHWKPAVELSSVICHVAEDLFFLLDSHSVDRERYPLEKSAS